MNLFKKCLLAIIVGIFVALTYMVFEFVLFNAIGIVWKDIFNTDENRLVIIPLSIVLSSVFFAARHYTTTDESQALASIRQLAMILSIGFLSLFAGASLGPEAVLIPASLSIGLIVSKYSKSNKSATLLGLSGFVALFVAFFSSLLGGLLGFYLATKSKKMNYSKKDYLVPFVSAISALILLQAFSHKGSFDFPATESDISLLWLVIGLGFLAAGWLSQHILAVLITVFKRMKTSFPRNWFFQTLLIAGGLSALYLLGGPLVEFTGSESIQPVFSQAESLGVASLIGIVLVKLIAIAWSESMGYIGGLIFPLIFVASTIVAATGLYTDDYHVGLNITLFIVGVLVADKNKNVIMDTK